MFLKMTFAKFRPLFVLNELSMSFQRNIYMTYVWSRYLVIYLPGYAPNEHTTQ